jgi:large subunit ribosomal protein L16
MLFVPKKMKYTKSQKGKSFNKIDKIRNGGNNLRFGSMGIKALETGRISSTQLLALRQTLHKYIKKNGKVFFNIFPHTPITKKPVKVRMGKGKGGVDHYVYKVKPGTVICEIETKSAELSKKALTQGMIKIPLLTKLIFEQKYYA